MLKITDVPIQSLVIKLRRAGKKSRQEHLEFLRLYIRENREIKTLMRFGPLTFWLLRKFLDIGGWKRGIRPVTLSWVYRHFLPCDENRTTPLGEFEKCKFALFQPEFFDSNLNNCRIQSRKIGFGVNIKSRKNAQNHGCAHTIPCNKTSMSREKISAEHLEFLRLYIRENREIKTLMRFGPLTFWLLRKFLDIGGWKGGVSQ